MMDEGKKRILFVDDEPNVLNGLRRSLRQQRNEWDMVFCSDPAEALEAMDEDPPFDLVVSDMMMPVMNGREFLTRVRERHPLTVRFALSGYSDSENVLNASSVAHQFLSKPCEGHALAMLIRRACALRDSLSSDALNKMLLQMGGVPSVPQVYGRILQEMQSEQPDISKLGALLEQDVGLSTRILKVVNSAGMGLRHHVADIAHAAILLGLENLKSLVLMAEVFDQAGRAGDAVKAINLDALWQQSLKVAGYARQIAEAASEAKEGPSLAFTAGLLHEIGQIVLATKLPESYLEVRAYARDRKVLLTEAEKEVLGTTHASIGGYLLGLWGLPDPIVEAISYFDFPSASPEELYATSAEEDEGVPTLASLHVACYLAADSEQGDAAPALALDTFYLERVGCLERVEDWFDLCAR